MQKEITDANLFLDTMPQIVQAIKVRDAERAEKEVQKHIDIFVERIKQELL